MAGAWRVFAITREMTDGFAPAFAQTNNLRELNLNEGSNDKNKKKTNNTLFLRLSN
uniref:Uncharacterized protein n=1 Tax=Nelumbo nucifera TaxID=4432 RepID=A0A822XXW8_NELNU|nr:TPA_asm: hypothetical protein HUJ06_025514 [Nelumbo nucifera]